MKFRELELGDRFELVTGNAGLWQKWGARTYIRAEGESRWRTKYIGKANDEVRLVEKKNNG
jgi:hypothetical protein